jgi:hypothetical protein
MRRFLRDNSLTLFFGLLCVLAILGDAAAGVRVFNAEAQQHGEETISFWRYLVSARFGEAMAENWQSEFLQFSFFIMATVWLYQRGSVDSKTKEDLGVESDQKELIGEHAKQGSPRWAKAGGLTTWLYSHSLMIVMTSFFAASWLVHSLTQWKMFNDEQLAHDEATVSWSRFVTMPDFWETTLQNWQSEFMALATMVIFSVYLRERGSHESKPVGEPHSSTGRSH